MKKEILYVIIQQFYTPGQYPENDGTYSYSECYFVRAEDETTALKKLWNRLDVKTEWVYAHGGYLADDFLYCIEEVDLCEEDDDVY